MTHKTVKSYIALGSNMAQPLQQIESAVAALRSHPNIEFIGQSSWYRSRAIGPGKQDDYVNGVVEILTTLPPIELLDALQSIEKQQGRIRIQHWGPRTLDLDILWYNNQSINTPRLCVPHPRMNERNFVIKPLHDLAPMLPLDGGQCVNEQLVQLGTEGLWIL